MEVKFRKKGNVITHFVHDVPQEIVVPEGFEGIDLTGYSVISIQGGKNVWKFYVPEARKNFPNSIVVYDFNYNNGFGSGINLPKNFSFDKLKFYKTAKQLKEENNKIKKQKMEELSQEILASIQGVRTSIWFDNNYVVVTPVQEAYSSLWGVEAKSLEEAISKVSEIMPLWKEWNERALEVYIRFSGKKNPGIGNIAISPSPMKNNLVQVYYSFSPFRSVYFEKQTDGSWLELQD